MELIKDMVIQVPEVKIVVLSMHDEMIYAERAIKAGARAYVMKQKQFSTSSYSHSSRPGGQSIH